MQNKKTKRNKQEQENLFFFLLNLEIHTLICHNVHTVTTLQKPLTLAYKCYKIKY